MNFTHRIFNESYNLKDDGEKSVFQKIQSLYKDLDERLHTNHVKSLANPYGEHNDISSVYIELKTHALAFTMEQLSHDTKLKYMMQKTQHPGKWCGTLFNVVLHWYKCIKEYMWLKLIGLPPTQNLCLMQSAVDDVVFLEYMQQNTCRTDSLSYLHVH
jgi:hypothetical protein